MTNFFHRRQPVGLLVLITIATIPAGCGGHAPTVLGLAPAAAASASVNQLTSISEKKTVTLHGEMTDKCPVAGCWFMLKDKTGVVRVDTKSAGFVVSTVPLHTELTVSGTVVAGAQPSLAATGVSY